MKFQFQEVFKKIIIVVLYHINFVLIQFLKIKIRIIQ